jgi:hypothetical protein
MNNDNEKQHADVPLWMLTHIGKCVRLTQPWTDGAIDYSIGQVAVLDGLTRHRDTVRALLVFDEDACGDLVDVPLDYIRPAEEVEAPALTKIPGRAGELALVWQSGVNLKKQLSKGTFYRYRKELLAHGIDITRSV